jgi:hypothetical protein
VQGLHPSDAGQGDPGQPAFGGAFALGQLGGPVGAHHPGRQVVLARHALRPPGQVDVRGQRGRLRDRGVALHHGRDEAVTAAGRGVAVVVEPERERRADEHDERQGAGHGYDQGREHHGEGATASGGRRHTVHASEEA